MMNKTLLKIFSGTLLTVCLSGCFDNAFKDIQESTELSNRVMIDSAKQMMSKIKLGQDSILKRQADSIYYAVLDINALIDNYKEQITNRSIVDKEKDLAYRVVAKPDFIKGALLSAGSSLDQAVSITRSYDANKIDSLLIDIRKINTDALYFEKTFKGIPPSNALAILSDLQLQSSVVGNFALGALIKKGK